MRVLLNWAGVLALSIISGCGFANAYNSNVSLTGTLLHDGFLDVVASHTPEFPQSGKPVTVSVTTSGSKQDVGLSASSAGVAGDPYSTIAQAAWTQFPYHFDQLDVTIVGAPQKTFTYSQLSSLFGPRPNGYDSATLASQVSSGYESVYIALGLMLVGLIIEIIRFEARKRNIHKDRLQEIAQSTGHYHVTTQQYDHWSGHQIDDTYSVHQIQPHQGGLPPGQIPGQYPGHQVGQPPGHSPGQHPGHQSSHHQGHNVPKAAPAFTWKPPESPGN